MLCLVVALFLAIQLFGARKRAKEAKGKFDAEVEFFSAVKKKNVKLVPENKNRAEQNADKAKKRFDHARKEMHRLFSISVTYDPDPYVAVRQLKLRVDAMRQRLLDAGIQLAPQHYLLSFDAYDTKIGDIPDARLMPEIFRQLNIIEDLVGLVVQSKVAGLNEISRPMGLERVEEDQYSYVPIRLSVTGTSAAVQDLLNRLHQVEETRRGHLFFVRNIESLGSQDQAPGGVLGGTGVTGATGGGMGGEAGMGPGGGAFGMPGIQPGGGAPGMDVGGMPGMGPEGMADQGGGMGGTTGALQAAVLLTREQLQAFRDRYVTAVVRLDLVEFVAPEQPEE